MELTSQSTTLERAVKFYMAEGGKVSLLSLQLHSTLFLVAFLHFLSRNKFNIISHTILPPQVWSAPMSSSFQYSNKYSSCWVPLYSLYTCHQLCIKSDFSFSIFIAKPKNIHLHSFQRLNMRYRPL
jgi:hypothetical protein